MNLYDEKSENYFADVRPEMLPLIPEWVESVLEIGCGNAGFSAALKAKRPGLRVTAIEPMPAAAAVARLRVDELIEGEVEACLSELAGRQFDCVVMNDVLEHLVDPWGLMRTLAHFLPAGRGVFVASLPNIRYLPVFKDYVQCGQWQYQNDGVMDRTHLRFFTQATVRESFETTGYVVEQLVGINPTALTWKVKFLNWLSGGRFDDLRYKQFACVARRTSYSGDVSTGGQHA